MIFFLKGRKIQRYYCSEAIELLRTQSSRFAFPIMLLMKSGTRIPKTRKLESDKIKPDLHPTDSQTQHSYIAKKTRKPKNNPIPKSRRLPEKKRKIVTRTQ